MKNKLISFFVFLLPVFLARTQVTLDSVSHMSVSCVGGTNSFSNGAIYITPSLSGAAYSWTGPGGFSSTLQDITGLVQPGQYTVVVSNRSGLNESATYSLGYYTDYSYFTGVDEVVVNNRPALKNVSGSNNWCRGAGSKNILVGGVDGWAEYKVTATNTHRIFGFSEYLTTSHCWTYLEYGVYLDAYGTIWRVLSGSQTSLGSYAVNDIIRVARIGTNLVIYKNNVALNTYSIGTIGQNKNLLLEASIWSANGLLENIGVSFKPPMPIDITVNNLHSNETGNLGSITVTPCGTGYSYSWAHGPTTSTVTNLAVGTYSVTITDGSGWMVKKDISVGYDANWSNQYNTQVTGDVITNTGGAGASFDAGANTVLTLSGGTDGWLEYEVTETSKEKAIGFTQNPVSTHPLSSIDYGFILYSDGTMKRTVSGTISAIMGSSKLGDIIRIQRTGSYIYYYRNGFQQANTSVNSAEALYIENSFYSSGGKFQNVRASFATTTPVSGNYTVGSVSANYLTISDAISSIENKEVVSPGVVFQLENGTYNEKIDLSTSVSIRTTSGGITFSNLDQTPSANVVVQSTKGALLIGNKGNVTISGMEFRVSDSSDVVVVDSTDSVSLSNLIITSDYSYVNAGVLSLSSNAFDIQDLNIQGSYFGVKVADASDVSISNCDLSTSINSGIDIQNISGTNTIDGNNIVVTSSGINFSGLNGTLNIQTNNIQSNQGIVYDNISDPYSANSKSLTVEDNSISTSSTSFKINSANKLAAIIKNNNISSTTDGILLQNSTNDLVNDFKLFGNLVEAHSQGFSMENLTANSTWVNNTVVSNASNIYKKSDNTVFCNNNVVNYGTGDVLIIEDTIIIDSIILNTIPSNISTSTNNWYSFTSGPVSNYPSLILQGTDVNVDPLFETGSYALSIKSPLRSMTINCLTEDIYFDLDENPRYRAFDVGSLEADEDGYEGLQIDFVLENNVSFTPGDPNYGTFVINGLSNYGAVSLEIYSPDNVLVYSSTSKTAFWDGTSQVTNVLVDEGAYRFNLQLDSKTTGGIVYVNR